MKQAEHELLYKLFRDHEDVIGESKTTILSLEALITSLMQLKCDKHEIKNQVASLFETIKNSEPKIMPLINLVVSINEEAIQKATFEKVSIKDIKNTLISFFKKGITLYKSNMENVIINGSSLIRDNDLVIVHSASSIVLHSLVKAKLDDEKNFKVLILKQDFIKTKQIIRTLDDAAIPYIIIPEHNLIHYIDGASMVLLGASSVTCDEKFIAAVGTTSIVGISHLHKIPVYLLVDTLKFSYFVCDEHRIHKKQLKEVHEDMEYSYTQFSHDIVQLKYIDSIITEKGAMSKEDVEKYFSL
jgi:translation initiation factor 2B subunit (eIF-2B alpha/beta/delta family)